MPMPPRLDEDVSQLRHDGYEIEVVEDGTRFYLILKAFVVPNPSYTPETTDLMLMADYLFPQSRMDMFWTEPYLRLLNGAEPQNANSYEPYCGRAWQRWSWHYPLWDPAKHSVQTHLATVVDRLEKGV